MQSEGGKMTKKHRISPRGKFALHMATTTLAMRAAGEVRIVLFADGSGRIERSQGRKEWAGIFSFNNSHELYDWLHGDLSTRARLMAKSQGPRRKAFDDFIMQNATETIQ